MILSPLLLLVLPLASARPHLPDTRADLRRYHHANARAPTVTERPLVERAGAAISNETREEISVWNHDHEAGTQSTVTSAAASSGVDGVGNALTAVSSAAQSSATPSSAAQTEAASTPEADTSPVAQPSVLDSETSQEAEPSVAQTPSASPSPSPSSSIETSEAISSPSIASSSTPSSVTRTTVVTASRSSTVVRVTASSSASAAASKDNQGPEKIAGLNKTTFIIIIVVAGAIALAAVGWTVFRKWKLRPSSRFDEKMRPIDFSPDNGPDPLYLEEKAYHRRTGSNMSAAMHRQELVAELDSKHVEGVPDHDFTAGGGANMAGHGAYDAYNQDPYAHAEAYEYDAAYHYDQRGFEHDQPTQDTGYADLQRGNSIGSGSGHGHGQQYPVESFPMPDHYLSRPAADGPYATSHRY